MKKLIIAIVITAMFLQMTAFAAFTDVSYNPDEEYKQTLATGFEYLGYSGELKFSVTEQNYEAVGAELTFDDGLPYPYKTKDFIIMGKSDDGNYSVRIKGRGLLAGTYTITPYVVADDVRSYGDTIPFEITQTCIALTNLRIAYDQIQYIEFNEKEQEIIDYVLPAVEQTIADGENDIEITKAYIRNKFQTEINNAKALYDAMDDKTEQNPFLSKLNAIDSDARAFLISHYLR